MLRFIISLALTAGVATSAQSQTPRTDTAVIAVNDTTAVTADSSIMRISHELPRPVAMARIEVSRERVGICKSIPRWKCAAYGALMVGALGYAIGEGMSAQPEYANVGFLFTHEECVKHCGMPHKAVVFGLSGSAVGGLAGWLIGRW